MEVKEEDAEFEEDSDPESFELLQTELLEA